MKTIIYFSVQSFMLYEKNFFLKQWGKCLLLLLLGRVGGSVVQGLASFSECSGTVDKPTAALLFVEKSRDGCFTSESLKVSNSTRKLTLYVTGHFFE